MIIFFLSGIIMSARNFPSDNFIYKKKKMVKRLEPLGSFTNRKERSLNIPDRVLLCVYLFQVEIRRKVNVQVSQGRKEAAVVVVVLRSSPARQRSTSPPPHLPLPYPSRHMCARIKNPSLHTVHAVSVKTEIKTASA